MSNTILTTDILAKEAVMILQNNLVFGGLFYRGYENEFDNVNGYMPGNALRIRRPNDFTVRTGQTASVQDVVEGSLSLSVNSIAGVDFQFTSQDLTQNIKDLSDRVIKPAMIQIANQIDGDCANLFNDVSNWVGTPGTTITTFAGFAKGPERLDLRAVPTDDRKAVLSPTDTWGMLGSQTALYMSDVAKSAYRRGQLGQVANIDTYSSQNIKTFTTGTRVGVAGGLINGASQTTSWASTKTTGTMSLNVKTLGTGLTVAAGDVFTIAGVFAVNPVTKVKSNYLQNFVVTTLATASANAASTATLVISPPIIVGGAFATVDSTPADGATMTFFGTASTSYPMNMIFHKNAFALAVVPMVKPPGAVDVARQSYKGVSVRVIPYYSGSNDISSYRLDVLYGVKTIDHRMATRISGT